MFEAYLGVAAEHWGPLDAGVLIGVLRKQPPMLLALVSRAHDARVDVELDISTMGCAPLCMIEQLDET